ncbi:hypothetical protein SNEBB_005609 [Seison nebaliae]|nr:hypothetical protein SNEBB_005609 [Seison nebaliae]
MKKSRGDVLSKGRPDRNVRLTQMIKCGMNINKWEKTNSRKYCGLTNFGNTCYANSILQALFFCEQFRNAVLKYSRSPTAKSTSHNLLDSLKDLFHQMNKNKSSSNVVAPKKFMNNLQISNPVFAQGLMQHDAHEFLNFLLNTCADIVHQNVPDIQSTNNVVSSNNHNGMNCNQIKMNGNENNDKFQHHTFQQTIRNFISTKNNTTKKYEKSIARQTNWVRDLFEGQLINETICLKCDTKSVKYEKFLDLPIEIEQNTSITHCLRNFSRRELLTGDSKYFCSECQCEQEAVKTMRIDRLPQILALHLKRFKFVESMGRHKKLSYRVTFCSELRLSHIMKNKNADNQSMYNLASFVIHCGSCPNRGHYITMACSNENDEWLLLDDDVIQNLPNGTSFFDKFFGLSPEFTKTLDTAYLLFYVAQMLENDEMNEKATLINSTSEQMPFAYESMGNMDEKQTPSEKVRSLGALMGVFVPVVLSMTSTHLFMRLGFILGNSGFYMSVLQLLLAFSILILTALSVCAIATNGAVKGGGIYYLISRCLGPEFGGAVGVIFFLATVIAAGLYTSAFVETLTSNFGLHGSIAIFPDSEWWKFLYAFIITLLYLLISILGASLFSKAVMGLFSIVVGVYTLVLLATCIKSSFQIEIPRTNSIIYQSSSDIDPTIAPPPNSTIFPNQTTTTTTTTSTSTTSVHLILSNLTTTTTTTLKPITTTSFDDGNSSDEAVYGNFTGFSLETFRNNRYTYYMEDYTTGNEVNFQIIFSVLFSSLTGIMAGASMSGDLKNASKSIPIGTLSAIVFVFFITIVEMVIIAFTCERFLLVNNYLFLQSIIFWSPLLFLGIICVTFSAGLSSMIGGSRILEALAADEIFGVITKPLKYKTKSGNPLIAVLLAWFLTVLTLLVGSMNTIAPMVTIFYLLSYFGINLACLALDLASPPNFRPTFRYYTWHTAFIGMLSTVVMAFIVDVIYATIGITLCIAIVSLLYFRDFPSAWGSISQALIFHQVRKYLLLLDPRKDHVKYWRPQVLLCVSNPKSVYPLISFVNALKKSGLFILGHVKEEDPNQIDYSTDDGCLQELSAWQNLVDMMQIKAFVSLTQSRTIREGIQQLTRICGLGGFRPNTIILGFYDDIEPMDLIPNELQSLSIKKEKTFEFSEIRSENCADRMNVEEYSKIITDCLYLQKNICLAKNFHLLYTPIKKTNIITNTEYGFLRYWYDMKNWCNRYRSFDNDNLYENMEISNVERQIHVWPSNIFTESQSEDFDTTSLFMLQLATILSMTSIWKKAKLRVFYPVNLSTSTLNGNTEHEQRLRRQLDELRITAEPRLIPWTPNSDEDYLEWVKKIVHNYSSFGNKSSHTILLLYLPLPPSLMQSTESDAQFYEKLALLAKDFPPTLFVHGMNACTCTQL